MNIYKTFGKIGMPKFLKFFKKKLTDLEGFEPSILRLGVLRPSRLGYKPIYKINKNHVIFIKIVKILADPPGFEPGVFGLEVRRPIQLGYGPYIKVC